MKITPLGNKRVRNGYLGKKIGIPWAKISAL